MKNTLSIKRITTTELIPYKNNSRTHSESQIAQIAASIREFGFTNPVLVDGDGGIVAGHGRVLAAIHLGMDTVPTIDVGWLTDTQRRAYIIADNKLALNAGWDDEILRLELADLNDEGFELELLGFTDDEILALDLDTPGDGDTPGADAPKGNLSDRFMIPPFSVLNAREGWWQNRKKAWLALGIKSEVGRGGTVSTSARVGPDDAATYRTIGGKRQAAAPGGSARRQRQASL